MKKTKRLKRKLAWFNYLLGRELNDAERSRIRRYVKAKDRYYSGNGENENERLWKDFSDREREMYKRLVALHESITRDARDIEAEIAMINRKGTDPRWLLEEQNDYDGFKYVAEVDG